MQHEGFTSKYKDIKNIYSVHEIDAFNKKFAIMIATGVGIILFGVMVLIIITGFLNENNNIPIVLFMSLVTISVGIFTYYGLQKDKYASSMDNKINKKEELSDVVAGIIMLIATLMFFIIGFVFKGWAYSWVVFPIGGIMCGIVGEIIKLVNIDH